MDGVVWPTSEHYFLALKFEGTEHVDLIRHAPTPAKAAELGRDRQRPLRVDWESVKEEVMRKAIRAKFTQHAELRELLLSTGTRELIEHTTRDRYWGDGGGEGRGLNRLGQLLMELRSELRLADEMPHESAADEATS